ncbi:MAG: helix-turn-helix domain-containing protein [Formivibrio sp.]|nr:helix-turn-helix domain-containing protein [Formivibrio sp.]
MTLPTPFKPLTKEDIAGILNISIRTVENWIKDGTLPAPHKIAQRVYWHPDIFYTWLDQRLKQADIESASDQAKECEMRASQPKPKASTKSRNELEILQAKTDSKLAKLMSETCRQPREVPGNILQLTD